MNKIAVYILLVVIGGAIGASALYFFSANQPTPIITEQDVAVTIQGITYENTEYPVLKIDLLNDAPQKDLDGTLRIIQGKNEWSSEATWTYTGEGSALVLCSSLVENQSFQIMYKEKNPQATYLNRTIEWNEIEKEEMVIGFMGTAELTITDVDFSSGTSIMLYVTNTGTRAATVSSIKVNGVTSSFTATSSNTVASGGQETFTVSCSTILGSKYSITLFSSDGTLLTSYTVTAT